MPFSTNLSIIYDEYGDVLLGTHTYALTVKKSWRKIWILTQIDHNRLLTVLTDNLTLPVSTRPVSKRPCSIGPVRFATGLGGDDLH